MFKEGVGDNLLLNWIPVSFFNSNNLPLSLHEFKINIIIRIYIILYGLNNSKIFNLIKFFHCLKINYKRLTITVSLLYIYTELIN